MNSLPLYKLIESTILYDKDLVEIYNDDNELLISKQRVEYLHSLEKYQMYREITVSWIESKYDNKLKKPYLRIYLNV